MCPACIGSAALLLLSGAGSAGGAAALTLRSIVRRRTPLPVSPGQHVAGKGLEDRVRAIAGVELAEHGKADLSGAYRGGPYRDPSRSALWRRSIRA
jgi:hypothetical protein